jgi:glycopeptide antibiotics resistance protein
MMEPLGYESRRRGKNERDFDALTVCQFVVTGIVLVMMLSLFDILINGGAPGVGAGLVCQDALLLLLMPFNIYFTLGKPRARLRRASSYCSWGAYLLYVVLSVIVAMR